MIVDREIEPAITMCTVQYLCASVDLVMGPCTVKPLQSMGQKHILLYNTVG